MLVMISLTSVSFYYFALLYASTSLKKSTIVFPLLYLLLIIGLVPTDLIVTGMQIDPYVNNAPVWGPLFPVWVLPVYLLVVLAGIRLFQFHKVSESYEDKNRSLYIIIGAGFCLIGGAFDLLPILGVDAPPGAILSNLLFCSIATAAILKYHLLDIHIVEKKGIAFFMISALVAVPYVSIILMVSQGLGTRFPLWSYVLMLVVLAAVLQPIWKWAQDWVDRLFYSDRYNHVKALREFNQRATQLTDVNQLVTPWLHALAPAMGTGKVCLLYSSPRGSDFLPISTTAVTDDFTGFTLNKESLLIQWLTHHQSPLHRLDFRVIPQLQALSSREKKFLLEEMQGELFFSLKVKDAVIGVLILGSRSSHQPYGEDDRQFLLPILPQVAISLDNARLYEAERKHSQELALLADLGKTITSRLSIHEVYESFVEELRSLASIDHAIVALFEEASDRLSIFATTQKVEPLWEVGDSIPLAGTAAAWVAAHRSLHYEPDLTQGQEFWPDKNLLEKGIRSIVHLPLYAKERIVGCFHVASLEPNAFDLGSLRFLQQVADQLALAVENSRLYSQEKQARLEIERQAKERTEFIDALVHEVKTPLTAILASSELMAVELSEDSSPLSDLADNLNSSAHNLDQRVSELTDFAKSQGHQLVLDIQPIYISGVVKQVTKQISTLLRNKGQNLSFELPVSLPQVKADTERVAQILFNLLTNASKFSPANTNISLRVYPVDAFLTLEVTNSAPPISPEEAKRIFTPYYRSESVQRTSGLGLGLSICKRLVELQGGKIWVHSQDAGNTFGFSLPLVRSRKQRGILKARGGEK